MYVCGVDGRGVQLYLRCNPYRLIEPPKKRGSLVGPVVGKGHHPQVLAYVLEHFPKATSGGFGRQWKKVSEGRRHDSHTDKEMVV